MGQTSNGTAEQTLIEHWNGTKWARQASPNPSSGSPTISTLTGVTAVSASSSWAVGYYYKDGNKHTLVEHWNGRKWSVQRSPNPGSTANQFNAVAASSSSNVWAAGYSSGPPEQTLVAHCC